MRTASIALVALSVLAGHASRSVAAEGDHQRGRRETKVERKEIDAAIIAAEASSAKVQEMVNQALDDTKQDGKKREAEIRQQVQDLVDALSRLREGFDEDAPWGDQRLEARTAYTKWKELDPVLRKHWMSHVRDEFEVLHVDLRELARIYEVDAPRR